MFSSDKNSESIIPDENYIKWDHLPTSFESPIYDKKYKESLEDVEAFWAKEAEEVVWTKKFTKILDKDSHPFIHQWFADGEINICYNCVDRHIDEGRGEYQAFGYESAYTGASENYTYNQLRDQVGKLATIM